MDEVFPAVHCDGLVLLHLKWLCVGHLLTIHIGGMKHSMPAVNRRHISFDQYVLMVLIAIELLMSFTFLGYIHIPPISFTIAYIPILIAGCILGPVQSTIVGFIFGITSMYKASASYVAYTDAVFSPFSSGAPLSSLVLSVGSRVLFGLLIGFGFTFAKNSKHQILWIGFVAAIGSKIHSFFVYTVMGIFFPELGYNYSNTFNFDKEDILFILLCAIVIPVLWKIYNSNTVTKIKKCLDSNIYNPYSSARINIFFAIFCVLLLCIAVFAASYFSQRTFYMLQRYGIPASEDIFIDLFILQTQFLIALLALCFITIVLFILIYKYMSYKQYTGELDALTGIMGRRMFLYYCQKIQEKSLKTSNSIGWFLIIDTDYFKKINDTFGHVVGDAVLKKIASSLQSVFGVFGKVGRMGGDEFAVILEKNFSQQELALHLDAFLDRISCILPDVKVSCSIGAHQFLFPIDITEILVETDNILYMAKEQGRACYVIKGVDAEEKHYT